MDLLENYLKPEPLPDDYDYTTLEEAALNEIIKLSPHYIEPMVSDIESAYSKTKEKIETSHKKTIEEHNNEYNCNVEQLGQTYQKQLDQTQKEYDLQKQSLNTLTKDKKKESADSTETVLAQSKENYEYEQPKFSFLEQIGSKFKIQEHCQHYGKYS